MQVYLKENNYNVKFKKVSAYINKRFKISTDNFHEEDSNEEASHEKDKT